MKCCDGADGLRVKKLHFCIEKQRHFREFLAGIFFPVFTTCYVSMEMKQVKKNWAKKVRTNEENGNKKRKVAKTF
jgi:hypothetical protein